MTGTKKGSPASSSYVNPHETLTGLSRFFIDGLKDQALDQGIKKIPTELKKEFFGETGGVLPASGELKPNQELDLRSVEKKQAKPKAEVLGGIDYRREVVQGVQMRRSREQQEMDQKLQEIMNELKRLVKSSTTISNEYAALTVEQGPQQVGSYHLNFFDFMLSVITNARRKVEDSGAWLAISKKKNSYQQKASTLGTKFTLSQERSTATQTG